MEAGATILLVDDSEDDVYFFERCLKKNNLPFRLHHAAHGGHAIAYLEGAGEFGDRDRFPFPKFIITDNNMPGMTGKEFLKWLKEHPRYSVVPTLLFSGAAPEGDVDYAYEHLGVHSYIFKPDDPAALEKMIRLIFDYWAVCALPKCKLSENCPSTV